MVFPCHSPLLRSVAAPSHQPLEELRIVNAQEICRRPDHHPNELFLQVDTNRRRSTKLNHRQSNTNPEPYHRALHTEHFTVEECRTLLATIEEIQMFLNRTLSNATGPLTRPPLGGRKGSLAPR